MRLKFYCRALIFFPEFPQYQVFLFYFFFAPISVDSRNGYRWEWGTAWRQKGNRFTALYDLMIFWFFLMLAGSPEIEDIPHNWTIKGLYWQIFWILLRLLFVRKYVVFIFHIYPWTPVFSMMEGGEFWGGSHGFIVRWRGVSRQQQSYKGGGGTTESN